MIRRRFLMAIVLVSLVCAPAAFAGDFDKIVYFGDSLSDPGNYFIAFGTVSLPPFVPIPDAPYAIGGHHFTNGETWAEQLSRALRRPASGEPALRAPGHFTNYAVGRARARAGAPTFPSYDLSTQVGRFLSDYGGHASPDNIYAIWIGANDLDDALNALVSDPTGATSGAIIQSAITAVAGNIQALWAAGARTVLLPNLPDLAITPAVRALGPAAEGAATQLTAAYNGALDQALQALQGLPQIRFVRLDVNALLAEVLVNPEAFGLKDVADACLTFGVSTGAVCEMPNRYLFWDGIHPTKAGHRIIAGAALRTLLPVIAQCVRPSDGGSGAAVAAAIGQAQD
jgi:phospholipase/lecithinase/hemolysin